jgi:hypothetical protein
MARIVHQPAGQSTRIYLGLSVDNFCAGAPQMLTSYFVYIPPLFTFSCIRISYPFIAVPAPFKAHPFAQARLSTTLAWSARRLRTVHGLSNIARERLSPSFTIPIQRRPLSITLHPKSTPAIVMPNFYDPAPYVVQPIDTERLSDVLKVCQTCSESVMPD